MPERRERPDVCGYRIIGEVACNNLPQSVSLSQSGWCKDKWGVSWQITPRVLTEALAAGGDEAKRAFSAMMGMKKIDIAAIKAARCG
jgi:predicted 3-demethylubiquinone-9 3-methyltransferase (glyoxalase superfamily)